MVNKFRYENNLPPFVVTGDRWARSNMLPQAALDEYFKGPGSTERFQFGWIALYNGFTGYSRLEIRDDGSATFSEEFPLMVHEIGAVLPEIRFSQSNLGSGAQLHILYMSKSAAE